MSVPQIPNLIRKLPAAVAMDSELEGVSLKVTRRRSCGPEPGMHVAPTVTRDSDSDYVTVSRSESAKK